MKHILPYLLFLTGLVSVGRAQETPEDGTKKQQKIQALYVAYITQQLSLTEVEAQKFWPVHAQFDAEIKSVNLDMEELSREEAILKIKKKYQDRFTGILGNSRSNNFYKIDGEFRKKLIEQLRKRRQQNMNQRQGQRRNF